MNSMNAKQSCIKCNKGGGVATCGGCQQWFCTRHFVEHRQELTTQIDNLGQEHDLLQRDLIEDHRKHPLLSYINNWEQKAIETIQNAAKKARSDLEKYVGENKKDLKVSLEQVSSAIKLCRESEDFTELELNKWFEQIKEIRNVLEKLPTSCIINENNTQNVLCLIEVEQTDRLKKPLKRSSDSVTSNTSLEYSAYRLPHPPGSIEDQSLANVMETSSDELSTRTICRKCAREFPMEKNSGGDCIHEGTWHEKFQDCSYLKCGFHLAKKASIGRQHWSCCYSLLHESTICSRSKPHVPIRPQIFN